MRLIRFAHSVCPLAGCPARGQAGTGEATSIDCAVMAFAAFVILLSLALSQLHSAYWLWLVASIGANLLQASFIGFCPVARVFKWLELGREAAFSGSEYRS